MILTSDRYIYKSSHVFHITVTHLAAICPLFATNMRLVRKRMAQ
jgi:hypothetical protein